MRYPVLSYKHKTLESLSDHVLIHGWIGFLYAKRAAFATLLHALHLLMSYVFQPLTD